MDGAFLPAFQVEKEMADMVGQAEEKERRLNKSRKRLEKKLVRRLFLGKLAIRRSS